MNTPYKIPFFAKSSLIFIGLFAFIAALYIVQGIIVPVIYATILAIVLSPLVNYFVRKGMNRLFAITLTVTIAIVVILLMITLLLSQLSMFSESLPGLLNKFDRLSHQMESWLSGKFNIRIFNVHKWINETSAGIMSGSRSMVGQTLVGVGSMLVILVLIPVYVFMILLYQPLLIEFIHKLFSASKHAAVNDVLTSTKRIIQSYLVGLSLEAVIIAILNSTCLLILGVDYAIFLGVVGAIVNVVPYIGGVIAVVLPMLIAFATKSPTYALLVLAGYVLIQFVDNHYIIPKIVASRVKINALVSIIVVLAGGALWGVPGMFLSIPLTAILKVIFDHVESMKAWGFLLGNIEPTAKPSFLNKIKVNSQPLKQ
jgi:predicted PurR-regulated permease PerM